MSYSRTWIAVITWWSSGIWAWFAEFFAQQWYELLLIAKSHKETVAFVTYLKKKYSTKITSLITDLSTQKGINKVIAKLNTLKTIDILINCAGFGINKDFLEQPFEQWKHMIMVHNIASIQFCYHVLPKMLHQKKGIIINVSSLAWFFAIGNNPIYAASKIFLHQFSRNIYRKYKPYGIYVQSLCPWFTKTNFIRHGWFAYKYKSMEVSDVIKASIKAMHKKKHTCIPWRTNNIILLIYQFLPSSWWNKIFNWITH